MSVATSLPVTPSSSMALAKPCISATRRPAQVNRMLSSWVLIGFVLLVAAVTALVDPPRDAVNRPAIVLRTIHRSSRNDRLST